MENILKFINENKLAFSILSTSLGLLIRVLSFLQVWGKKEISVFLRKSKLHDSTQAVIWNSGKKLITKSDFSNKGAMRITSKTEIASVELVHNTDEYNEIDFEKNKNELLINFEYLEINTGIFFYLDAGTNDDYQISGKLVDGKIKRTNIVKWAKFQYSIQVAVTFLTSFGVIFFLVWFFDSFLKLDINYNGKHEWVVFPVLFTYSALGIYLILTLDKRIKKIYRDAYNFFED